ncbi:CTP synthetase [Halobacteriales archaeon QS_1_68_20]|nr:MAG: CTP synthetase [Halobacteriales archaeon QS_1_68_20]
MKGIFSGPDDDGIASALEAAGVDLRRVDGVATRPALEEAGVHEADLLVLTDVSQATAIPIARDLNGELRVVVYTTDSLPEYVRGMDVLKVDPRLLDAETVASELVEG